MTLLTFLVDHAEVVIPLGILSAVLMARSFLRANRVVTEAEQLVRARQVTGTVQ